MTLSKLAFIALISALAIGQAEAAQLRNKATVGPTTPPAASQTIKSNSGPVGDEYCKNGSTIHVPCDKIFKAYCEKVLHGTMSGRQGWGGQTCFEPS